MSFESLEKVPRETSNLCVLEMKFYALFDGDVFGSALLDCPLYVAVLMMITWVCSCIFNDKIHLRKLRQASN